eukprot:1541057-Prorocentrum_lima.AAC.1
MGVAVGITSGALCRNAHNVEVSRLSRLAHQLLHRAGMKLWRQPESRWPEHSSNGVLRGLH